MPALHASAAVLAVAEVDDELTPNRTAWNLGLVLAGGMRFRQMPAPTLRTAVWQRNVLPLVDLVGRGNRTVDMLSVPSLLLGARFPGRGRGAVGLAERRRLSLAGPLRDFQRGSQPLDGRTQACGFRPQPRHLGFQFSASPVHAEAQLA